jgi:starch synthase
MRIALLTREWPPELYGGAGVHVEHLAPQLRRLVDVDVHCFGAARSDAMAYQPPVELPSANPAIATLGVDLRMADALGGADLAHSHTWYTNLAGHLGGLLHGIPHVITAHSLEPMRPWKAEQLGGGYRISSWVEQESYRAADAIIAVSNGMRNDVLVAYQEVDPDRVFVVHNGIDVAQYRPAPDPEVAARHGLTGERPFVLFVGRITRQKGLPHLLRAARLLTADAQIVLCAAAPDTPELAAEVADAVAELRRDHGPDAVVWIEQMLPRAELIALYSAAAAFVCPSVYEPLGIVNLEAMACGTAVVASDVGGIPEVVDDGTTGILAHYDPAATDAFEFGLATALDRLLADPGLARRMGSAGRERAAAQFSWDAIAAKTVAVYEQVLGR